MAVMLTVAPSVVLVACASTSVDLVTEATSTTTSTTTSTNASTITTTSTPAARPPIDLMATTADYDFWAFGTAAVSEVERYRSIAEMADGATAVVVGRVVAAAEPRVLETDTPEDVFRVERFTVEVEYVVTGELPIGGPEIVLEPQLAGASREPPPGPALLFLRYKGENQQPDDTSPVAVGDRESYRLVSSQGVLIEIDGEAVNPSADHENRSDPVNEDAAGRPLGEIINELLDR